MLQVQGHGKACCVNVNMGRGSVRRQRVIFNLKLKTMGNGDGASLALLRHRQQAFRRDAFVGHDAEEFAGGHAGVFGEHLKVRSGGEPFAQFPQVDGIDGESQVGGNLF